MKRRYVSGVHAIAVTVALCAVPRAAAAQTKEQCLDAFEDGQTLRNEMKLRAARDAFRACAAEACSPPVRKDCLEFLEEVSRDVPTLVVGAHAPDGSDLPNVAVQIDGKRVSTPAGFPVEVDPGPRTLRFERAPWAPIEQRVVVRAGERNRLVVVTFAALEAPASEAPASTDRSPHTARSPSSTSPWAYVAGAAGAAALGSFAFFGLSGMSERAHLQDTCAPWCSDSALASVRTRFLVADISLGVAVVSLAAAAVLLLTPRAGNVKAAWPPGGHFFARSF